MENEDLPNKLYDAICRLVNVNDFLSVGVVEVSNPNGQTVNCLFPLNRPMVDIGVRRGQNI